MRRRLFPRAAPLLAVPLLLAAGKCNRVATVDVKVHTRVYEDGAVDRSMTVTERPGEASLPLADEGIAIPSPGSWRRIETEGQTATAEGSFPRAADVPPLLEHALDDGTTRPDHHRLDIEIQDLAIVRVYRYREVEADPFGPGEVAAAFDKALDLLIPAARGALASRLGSDLDTSRMERFLRGAFKDAVVDTVTSFDDLASASGVYPRARSIFAARGMSLPSVPKGSDDDGTEAFQGWLAGQLAATLGTKQRPVAAGDTAFLLDPASYEPGGAMARRLPVPAEGHEPWEQVLAPFVDAASGFYASRHDSPMTGKLLFLFQPRLEMPGRLLTTNGTIDGDEVMWVFGDRAVTRAGRVMQARSAVVLSEPLRRLGLPPDLDLVRLVRIVQLLTTEDSAEHTLARLKQAISERKPELLYAPDKAESDEPTLGDVQLYELGQLLGVPAPEKKTGD